MRLLNMCLCLLMTGRWLLVLSASAEQKVLPINHGAKKDSLSAAWTKTSALSIGWRSLSSDGASKKLIALPSVNGENPSPKPIYQSDDYGGSWFVSSAPEKLWNLCYSSDSGENLIASEESGEIYVSSDSGSTWTKSMETGVASWRSLHTDSTGRIIVAAGISMDNSGVIFESNNYGQTWTRSDKLASRRLTAVVKSERYMIAATENGVLRTSNYGYTWTAVSSLSGRPWNYLASSTAGHIAVVTTGSTATTHGLYLSMDYGATWYAKLQNYVYVTGVAVSSNGDYMAATTNYNNRVYVSSNFGNTWISILPPSVMSWGGAVTIDITGQFIMAGQSDGAGGGAMYTYGPTLRTVAPTVAPTVHPTSTPTVSHQPTVSPTFSPTVTPTLAPTQQPTVSPTEQPSAPPSKHPTFAPTQTPTLFPTAVPSHQPTESPTVSPTLIPTTAPTVTPSSAPTMQPTLSPTQRPTTLPTLTPSVSPTAVPTQPTQKPATLSPTRGPTRLPTIAPTAAQIYQTSVQQTLKGVSKSQYVADWEANNLAWCSAVATAIDGAPEDCKVTSVEAAAAAAEALRRRLSTISGVDIGYTVTFDIVALGHPGNPATALDGITAALHSSVASGNFSAALMEYAQAHGVSALTNVSTTTVTVATTYSAVTSESLDGSNKNSSDTKNIIIGVVIGGGGGLALIALCVLSFYCSGSSSSTTAHSRVDTDEGAIECVGTTNSMEQQNEKGIVVVGRSPELML